MVELICRKVELKEDASWAAIESAFRGASACEMGQAWRDGLQPEFRGARVQVGWRGGELLVYAVLQDDDAFNTITEFNGMLFLNGDVFEMFLRPDAQDAYFEFHVSPENTLFQLRIPSAEAFRQLMSSPGLPAEWFIRAPVIRTRVQVESEQKRWKVLACIPFDRVSEKARTLPGSRWRFSFSRYDYTRGRSEPVHSSTSPHRQLNYHIQEDWGTIVFVDEKAG